MMPTAKEAERALGRAVQARAVADLVAENLSRGPADLDFDKIATLAHVSGAVCSLLDDVIDLIERVRDEVVMEDRS